MHGPRIRLAFSSSVSLTRAEHAWLALDMDSKYGRKLSVVDGDENDADGVGADGDERR